MQKIMFNDKYGLTKAVVNGTKTLTRRFIQSYDSYETVDIKGKSLKFYGYNKVDRIRILPSYQVGEIVAIAQSYKDIISQKKFGEVWAVGNDITPNEAGYNNKMFVKALLMPHNIQITNIKIERLQDISNEDCLKEGISDVIVGCEYKMYGFENMKKGDYNLFKTPRAAYSVLIDKISGKGTWESNPYVFVYEFRL